MTLVLCLAVGLSACARQGVGGGGAGMPSDEKPDSPVSGTPGEEPSASGSVREESDPTVFDPHPVAVDHYTIGADGRTVAVYWWGGNTTCFGLKSIAADVEAGTPVITVLEGTREAARDRMCTMEAVLKSALVTLHDPLLADAANPDPPAGEALLPGEAQPVHPEPGVIDPRPHAVTGYSLSDDGVTLSIHYVGGTDACYGLAAATAEGDGTGPLTVSVREGRLPGGDAACDDIGLAKVVELTLDQPLIRSTASV